MPLAGTKVALIGDLHGRWNQLDNDYFDRADYDLLLFVGDLGAGSRKNALAVVRLLSRLRTPCLILPGNNDAPFLPEIHAELTHQAGKAEILRQVLGAQSFGAQSCGYSLHKLFLGTAEDFVSLIAARPCAMGGSEFSFSKEVKERHGVGTLSESVQRLRDLVDESETEALLFLAHNGPTGLGDDPSDLWGRDFPLAAEVEESAPQDWGDSDLRDAITYAESKGKRVVGVFAGHMHRSRTGGNRPLSQKRGDTVYLNPAVVPRIRGGEFGEVHHHVSLSLEAVPGRGVERIRFEDQFVELS